MIIGCGALGARVAALWHAKGARVSALARSTTSVARLQGQGLQTVDGDLDDVRSLAKLAVDDAILYYFVPPLSQGIKDLRMRAFAEAVIQPPRRMVYLSTTGVYGDCGGAWIDEDRPANPQHDRGRRRRDGECVAQAWAQKHHVPLVILRVAGIYGPGRLPLARIQRATPLLNEKESGFTNRIHIDDLAQVCVAAAERGTPGRVYNVTDGQPCTMTHYFYRIADTFGLARPPTVSRDVAQEILSPGMLSYLDESRRIKNSRMLEELGVTLKYPNLDVGLEATKAQQDAII